MSERKQNFLPSIFLFLIIFSSAIFFPVGVSADSSTIITDDIVTDTVWTSIDSPYLVTNSISVATGVALTIEPGVVVKFLDSRLNIFGSLVADGTEAEPISFTSFYDEEVGGDTDDETFCYENIDEEGNVIEEICESFDLGEPLSGDWGGVYFKNSSGSILKHTSFRYAYNTISIKTSTVDFENLKIQDGVAAIEIFRDSVVSLLGVDITNIERGVIDIYDESIVSMRGTRIHDVFGDAINVYEQSEVFLEDILIEDVTGAGIVVYNKSSVGLKNITIENITSGGITVFNQSSVEFEGVAISSAPRNMVEVFDGSSFSGQGLDIDSSLVEFSDTIVIFNNADLYIKNSKITNCPTGGCVTVYDDGDYLANPSTANIEETIFDTGSGSGVLTFGESDMNITISRSSFNYFGYYAVENYSDFSITAENNFWGDASGPYSEELNPAGLGEVIFGNVSFDPWCENIDCKTRYPVIIVPGLLGTEINKPTADGPEKLWLDLARNLLDIGDEFMDALQFNEDLTPFDTSLTIGDVIRKAVLDVQVDEITLLNYSFGLIEEFEKQGYVEGVDLFSFPYDWRYGVSEDTVTKLKQKIIDVLTQTGSDKVNIVAHSMGGLITKKYVVENPEHYLGKVVMVGVPNTGAPKAVKNLIVGDGNLLTANSAMKKISKNMPAAYDVVPSQEYFNKKGSYIKIIDQYALSNKPKDLNFEESNIFIVNDHKLNAQALVNANNLHTEQFDNYDMRTAGVDLYSVNGCKAGTMGKFIEARYHGIFGSEDYTISNFKVEQVPGDGTVPLESATNLPINQENKYYALNASHAEMMSQDGIRQKIVNILSGSELSTQNEDGEDIITQDIAKCELNGRAIAIYSPLAIEIIDQDDNRTGFYEDGTSIQNDIPNASFEVFGEQKFIFLPTDDGQTYIINISGTGNGVFTLTDAVIESNEIVAMQVFENIAVTPSLLGRVTLAENTTLTLDNDGDGNDDQTIVPTSSLSVDEAESFVPHTEEEIVEDSPEEESSNTSGSSARSSVVAIAEPVLLPEILPEIPAVIQDTIARVVTNEEAGNSDEEIEDSPAAEQGETVGKTALTANIVDSSAPANNKITVITIISALGIILLVKMFYRV